MITILIYCYDKFQLFKNLQNYLYCQDLVSVISSLFVQRELHINKCENVIITTNNTSVRDWCPTEKYY